MFRNQTTLFQRVHLPESVPDVQMRDVDDAGADEPDEEIVPSTDPCRVNGNLEPDAGNRLVIAIDFGTTFSTVAYISLNPSTPGFSVRPDQVLCVDHYPDIPPSSASASVVEVNENVPTELWYVEGVLDYCDSSSGDSEIDVDDYLSDDSKEDSSNLQVGARVVALQGEKQADFLWGFGVHDGLLKPGKFSDTRTRIQRFKLMLDFQGGKTVKVRRDLLDQLSILKRRKIMKNQEQMISDYLEQLLRHARRRLKATGDLRQNSQIEFVLCVPNLWSEKACRIMHDRMATAIKCAGLGGLNQECVDNLFIVAEPEAAAEFVLSSFLENDQMSAGETFVLLDAGGGTVDATTYKVTHTNPVRLEKQAIVDGGGLCGSSFLNENYRRCLKDRLQDESLAIEGITFNDYIDSLVTTWENGDKRSIDVTNRKREPNDVSISGLQRNPEKGFRASYMGWTREQMKEIFDPVLKGVVDILKEQLKAAKDPAIGLNVTKVVLIGGFSESPSLEQVLKSYLARQQNLRGLPIELLIPERFRTSAVARGAVLRALRKEYGPERYSRSSFGFKRTELYDPDRYPQHTGIKPKPDPEDGLDNIDNTIYWVIQKVSFCATVQIALIANDGSHRMSSFQQCTGLR